MIMKNTFSILSLMVFCIPSFGQKIISEGTITYNISTETNGKAVQPDPLAGATNAVLLKGNLSRVDISSSLGKETTIYDAKIGSGVILKEYSGQKLMVVLSKENFENKNKRFEGITFNLSAETKSIAGYSCNRATAQLKDGSSLTVYYTPSIICNNKEYNPAFKSLQGFPVEYELDGGKMKFRYTLATIDYASVPLSKFDVPKSGYRVMTYDDNRQSKKDAN